MLEQTLVIIKPDGLKRGLVGEIVTRFENVGLKLVSARMVRATRGLLEKHYPADRKYKTNLGKKTLELYKRYQYDPKQILGTDDPYEIGSDVYEKLMDYMTSGPVVLLVWEGIGAVRLVRKLVGSTTPLDAEVGTIRGDLSHDSQLSAPLKGRALNTLVHASGTEEEAKKEIDLWFGKDFRAKEYIRVDEDFF